MKTRKEAVELVMRQLRVHQDYEPKTPLGRDKPSCHHYGKQELRELLDFIYEGQPADDSEAIAGKAWDN